MAPQGQVLLYEMLRKSWFPLHPLQIGTSSWTIKLTLFPRHPRLCPVLWERLLFPANIIHLVANSLSRYSQLKQGYGSFPRNPLICKALLPSVGDPVLWGMHENTALIQKHPDMGVLAGGNHSRGLQALKPHFKTYISSVWP